MSALPIMIRLPDGPCPDCGRPAPDARRPGPCPCTAHEAALEGVLRRAVALDPEGAGHPGRVGRIAALLGEALGVAPEDRALLERAAVLHDVGKLALPEGVLGHRHVLDPAARRVMERHTVLGAGLLAHARADWMRLASTVALAHHERWDGSGYPHGLAGKAIPLAARLVAVADVYDALRSERAYKNAQDHAEAMARLLEGDERIAPRQFDPRILGALRDVAQDLAAMPR